MSTAAVVKEAYTQLAASLTKHHHIRHAIAMLDWDAATQMPEGGAEARGAANAVLSELAHHELTATKNVANLATLRAAGDEALAALGDIERANVREIGRVLDASVKLPVDLVARKAALSTESEMHWRKCRAANDWASFEPMMKRVFDLAREEGQALATGTDRSPYEALLDQYEPGMRQAEVDALFNDLKGWLPQLLKDRLAADAAKGDAAKPTPLRGGYSVEKQQKLCRALQESLKFDFTRGRADTSAHPMCAGVPEDVRVTNRFNESDVMSAIMGVVHETGHAKYEQNRPREWLSQPVSQARSMGVHESQSLLHEMQMGRSPAFIKHLRGKLLESFDDEPAFELQNLIRLSQSVRPGKIRVDADELTYPLHVLLRYEIESAIVGGSMQVSDIPAYWETKMQEYLGVDVKGDFKNGCLQDIHWPVGLIGYFPTYTLGAMFAARFMHALRRDLGAAEIDAAMERGDFEAVSKWLAERVWNKGSILETRELIHTATGDDDVPTSEFYRRHLTERYGPK